ncbi:MAG: hypothetical protein U5R49_22000 [Deltaproteobacteria bacterium]|nr:hypothetical protein [Deltaproteobacteria bacterium]
MKAKNKTKILNFRIEEELHAKVKSVAIASRKTVTELIVDIIRDNIDQYSENALMDQLKQLPTKKRDELLKKLESEK